MKIDLSKQEIAEILECVEKQRNHIIRQLPKKAGRNGLFAINPELESLQKEDNRLKALTEKLTKTLEK